MTTMDAKEANAPLTGRLVVTDMLFARDQRATLIAFNAELIRS